MVGERKRRAGPLSGCFFVVIGAYTRLVIN